MDLTLTRLKKGADGIFSELEDTDGEFVAYTLERAYAVPNSFPTEWGPKIPAGEYICIRGIHQLANGKPFETFEVLGVAGHTGLLFHCGNFDSDSQGCILLGQQIQNINAETKMVTQSQVAFANFRALEAAINSFMLTVVED